MIAWPATAARGQFRHLGREIDGSSGAAALVSCADPFTSEMHDDFESVIVRVRRTLLMPLLPGAEAALMRPISRDHPPFRLLHAYLAILRSSDVANSPELAASVSAHVCDLIALSVGTARDAGVLASRRGVRAARLVAVKRWMAEHLCEPGLSAAAAAAVQGVSPRYVQMLFEAEGTTFSEFLRRERLACARRQLANPLLATKPVSSIAFDSGFGDLSYFNRAFRAAFGATPSDVRHQEGRAGG